MQLIQAIDGVFDSPALTAAGWGMAASFALCVLMVLTKNWHGALTIDSTDGIQTFHTAPTPPIVLGLIVAWSKAPEDVQHTITTILLAGLLAFLFSVAEDITKRVGMLYLLLATMAPALLTSRIKNYSLIWVRMIFSNLKITMEGWPTKSVGKRCTVAI